MHLNQIATEITLTGSKTLGLYCSYYIGMQQYKTKVIDGSHIIHNGKKYMVSK